MKRLPLLLALIVGITGMAGTAPAAAGQNAEGAGTISLAWDTDGPYTETLGVPLFAGAGIVPGDSGEQSFAVRNDGPTDGVLTASIVNVELAGDPNDPFYDDLLLNGEPVSGYHGQDTEILETTLGRGEYLTVDLSYLFPDEAVTGDDSDSTVKVSFDVAMQLRGETPADQRPERDDASIDESPDPDGVPVNEQSPHQDDTSAADEAPQPGETLPVGETAEQDDGKEAVAVQDSDRDDGDGTPQASGDGLAYTGTDLLWAIGAGLLLVLLGGLMMLLRRRESGLPPASIETSRI